MNGILSQRRFGMGATALTLSVLLVGVAAAQGYRPTNNGGYSNGGYSNGGYRPAYGQRTIDRGYQFGKRSHIEDLAADLRWKANAVCLDMYENYQNNRGFREAYREMYSILQDAKRLQVLAGQGYYRSRHAKDDQIARELHDMDRLFHHIEDDVRRWQPDRSRPGRQRDTLAVKMEYFEETLHHLMEDYGERTRIGGRSHDDHDHDHDHDRRDYRGPNRETNRDQFRPR